MPAFGGVRARLTAAVLALIVLATVVLGVGAALFVDARLHAQALEAARDQAAFDLSVVVPGRQLPDRPTGDDIRASALIDTFNQRGVKTVIDVGPDEPPVLSNVDLQGLLDRLPAGMRDLVARGQLAYAWTDVAGAPSLVMGGRPAAGGPAFYFVHNVSGIEDAINQLRLALFAGAIILLLLALATIRVVVRGVLAPVEEAGRVAGKQHRERSVIQPRNDRVRVWFVATALHLFFCKQRFGWRENSQECTTAKVIFRSGLRPCVSRAARSQSRFVIVVELCDRRDLLRRCGLWRRLGCRFFGRRSGLRRQEIRRDARFLTVVDHI